MTNALLGKIIAGVFLGGIGTFITVHAITSHNVDAPGEVHQVGEVKVDNVNLPPASKSKIDELNQIKKEQNKKPDGDQYVQAIDLNNLVKNDNPPVDQPQPKAVAAPQPTAPLVKTITGPSANANYNPYASNDPSPKQTAQASQSAAAAPPPVASAPASPFGTIIVNRATSKGAGGVSNMSSGKDYFQAQVYGEQKLMEGYAFICRCTEDMNYYGLKIPKNSIFYGICHFKGNRLEIKINKVKTNSGEYPVSYLVMDNDRLEGLFSKAPIDDVMDEQAQQANPNTQIPTNTTQYLANTVNNTAKSVVQGAKSLYAKTRNLNVNEGYAIFLLPIKPNNR